MCVLSEVSDHLVQLLQERHDLQQQVEMRQIAVEQLLSWQRVVGEVVGTEADRHRPLSTATTIGANDAMERSFTVPRSGLRTSTTQYTRRNVLRQSANDSIVSLSDFLAQDHRLRINSATIIQGLKSYASFSRESSSSPDSHLKRD